MRKIPFFVFTRVGIGVTNQSHYDRVLPLFEAVTLPSLKGQTDPDFHWMIAVDANIPPKARNRLLALVEDQPQIHVVPIQTTELREMHIGSFNWIEKDFHRLALAKGLVQRADEFIITSLIDCDDAWHEDTISLIRANALQRVPALILSEQNKVFLAASIAGAAMTFPNGFKWHPLSGALVNLCYPWLSMSIFVLSRFSAGIYSFSCRHDCWPLMTQIVTFQAEELLAPSPMWIHTRHSENLSGAFGYGAHEVISDTSQFHKFHIDAAALSRWREALPADKGSERPGKHEMAFRQYALMFRIAALNKQIDVLKSAMTTAYSQKLDDILQQAINNRQSLLSEYDRTSALI